MIENVKVSFKNNIPKCFSYLRKRKIGILGGSFNPAHAGHIHISNTARISLGVDEVWWLVAPQNRLKSSCLLYTSPSPRDATLYRMPSSA